MLHDMWRPVGDVLAIGGIVPTVILMVPCLLVVVALVGLWAVFHHMDNRLLCSCIMVGEMVLVSVVVCFVNTSMFIGVSRRIVDAGRSVTSFGVVPDGVIMGFAAVLVYSLVPSFLLLLYTIVRVIGRDG
jgi:hypothetical protein